MLMKVPIVVTDLRADVRCAVASSTHRLRDRASHGNRAVSALSGQRWSNGAAGWENRPHLPPPMATHSRGTRWSVSGNLAARSHAMERSHEAGSVTRLPRRPRSMSRERRMGVGCATRIPSTDPLAWRGDRHARTHPHRCRTRCPDAAARDDSADGADEQASGQLVGMRKERLTINA